MSNYIVQKESLETVADSIRAKAGTTEKLEFPSGWKAAVENIPSAGDAVIGRRLDYIQTTGTQYFDTGVIPDATTETEIQYSVQKFSNYGPHLLSSDNFYFPFARPDAFFAMRDGNTSTPLGTPSLNTVYTIKAYPSNKIIINDADCGTLQAGSALSTKSLYMCTYAGSPGSAGSTGSMTVYYCKIWKNGALVRDFIPYNSPAGEVGMLDLVEDKLYTSIGSGQFVAGNITGYVIRPGEGTQTGGGDDYRKIETVANIGAAVSITAEDVPEPEETTYAIHTGWYVDTGVTHSSDGCVSYSFPVKQGKTYTITMVEIGNRLRCGFTTTDPSTITPDYASNAVVSDYVDHTSNLTVGYVFAYTAKADGWYLVYVSNQNQTPKISIVVEE